MACGLAACENDSTIERLPNPGDDTGLVNDDRAALAACDAPEPCTRGGAGKIDNTSYSLGAGTSCVLEALAQRRPGRYAYSTDDRHAAGGTDVDYVLLIAADGSVQLARTIREDDFLYAQSTTVTPEPARRCTPKPASYFEGCLGAIEARPEPRMGQFPEPFWACVFGNGQTRELEWFESCEAESPAACDTDGYHPAPDAGTGAGGAVDAGAGDDAGPGDAG